MPPRCGMVHILPGRGGRIDALAVAPNLRESLHEARPEQVDVQAVALRHGLERRAGVKRHVQHSMRHRAPRRVQPELVHHAHTHVVRAVRQDLLPLVRRLRAIAHAGGDAVHADLVALLAGGCPGDERPRVARNGHHGGGRCVADNEGRVFRPVAENAVCVLCAHTPVHVARRQRRDVDHGRLCGVFPGREVHPDALVGAVLDLPARLRRAGGNDVPPGERHHPRALEDLVDRGEDLRRGQAVHGGDGHPGRPGALLVPLGRGLHAPLEARGRKAGRDGKGHRVAGHGVFRARALRAVADLDLGRGLHDISVDVRRVVRKAPRQAPARDRADIAAVSGRHLSDRDGDGRHGQVQAQDVPAVERVIGLLVDLDGRAEGGADHHAVVKGAQDVLRALALLAAKDRDPGVAGGKGGRRGDGAHAGAGDLRVQVRPPCQFRLHIFLQRVDVADIAGIYVVVPPAPGADLRLHDPKAADPAGVVVVPGPPLLRVPVDIGGLERAAGAHLHRLRAAGIGL